VLAIFADTDLTNSARRLSPIRFAMEDVSAENTPEMMEAANLLEKIADNPYEYENHLAYITLLRKLGATEDLHQARQVFHSLYPFSEGISSAPLLFYWIFG
jgi:hypothetical protein